MPTQPGLGGSPPPPGRRLPGGPATPHDAAFRRIFGVPENMASQLRAVLPPGLTARLDLAQHALSPASAPLTASPQSRPKTPIPLASPTLASTPSACG
jgi:hypothetical protein